MLYPVSFLNALTEFLRNLLGIREPGEVVSLQSGHSFSSDSTRTVRTPKNYVTNQISFTILPIHFHLQSSQNELPQQGIITASVNKSLQILQIKSSGISCFCSVTAGGAATVGLINDKMNQ